MHGGKISKFKGGLGVQNTWEKMGKELYSRGNKGPWCEANGLGVHLMKSEGPLNAHS